jgi:hypothetical protein
MKSFIIALFLLPLLAFAQTTVITTNLWVDISPTVICGKRYVGYIAFKKPVGSGLWGYKTNSYPLTSTCSNGNYMVYLGKKGDTGTNCNGQLTIPQPAFSDYYRFSVYFTNKVSLCTITNTGFLP